MSMFRHIIRSIRVFRQRLIGRAGDGLLLRRDFRLMWMSGTLSSFTNQVTVLALPLTAVVILRASPSQMGILGALEALPFALFSLQAGVLIDRHRKRPIVIASTTFIAATLMLVPLLASFGRLSMGLLYVVAFLLGCAFVVVGTASQVLLTEIAGRDRLIEANSLFTVSDSAARLTGPGIAGLLIQWCTAPIAILIDGIGCLASLWFIARMRAGEAATDARSGASILSEIREGLMLVRGHPVLRILTLCAASWFLLFQGFMALETIYMSRILGLSAGQIGLAHMVGGLGAMIAATSARSITRRFGMGAPILAGISTSALSWLALASIPRALGAILAGPALCIMDFGVTLYWINFSSLRQSVTPDAMLGRMTATMRFFTVALAPVGAYGSGMLAEFFGLRDTLAGLGFCVLTFAVLLYSLTSLRRVPDLSCAANPGQA